MVFLNLHFSRPDGRVYNGQWENGKQHGFGSYINAKGVKVEAEWNCGKKVRKLEEGETGNDGQKDAFAGGNEGDD